MLKKTVTLMQLCSMIMCSILPLFLFFFFPMLCQAQVTPQEGSILNYRIVGISFPAKDTATQYIVEIANGNFTDNKDFARHVDQTFSTDKNKVVVEVPDFGSRYTWRVAYKDCRSALKISRLYHFATGNIPVPASNAKRLRTDLNTGQYADGYIVIDGCNVMYDMDGRPVWYMPDIVSLNLENDVKATPTGTFTFLSGGNGYEIGYSGKILWSAKGKSDAINSDFYCHHELNKLNNGHYMALTGLKPEAPREPQNDDKRVRFFNQVGSSQLVEYDRDGSIIWFFESAKYAGQSDLWDLQQQFPKAHLDLHENAFYFDEKDSVIYLGLSGVNRILKIQYPSRSILGDYGSKFIASQQTVCAEHSNIEQEVFGRKSIFGRQHALACSDSGYLYVYNNNTKFGADISESLINYPQVIKMKQSGDSLQKVWEFDCRSIIGDLSVMPGGGGNVVIMPDNALLVSMCNPYGNIFIVDSDKNIVWSAVAEVCQPDGGWVKHSMYRASFVSRKQLEQMIWSGL